MNIFYQIISLSVPLLLAGLGGLISEFAGRMAIFLEGAINLGAFFCFLFTVKTENVFFGYFTAVILCTLIFYFSALFIENSNINPFIFSLGLNLFCTGAISFMSAVFFGTRGVLTHSAFYFDSAKIRMITTIFALLITFLFLLFIFCTKKGLYLRICASDRDFLEDRGISTKKIRILSWGAAAFFAGSAGCIFSLRLNSFVPGISSGTGWLALAAVFLGKKKPFGVLLSAIIFSAAQYLASNLQNFTEFKAVSASVLLSLPYFIALFFIMTTNFKGRD